MPNPLRIRDRYMRDSLPVRIGGIAANLSRIRSFSQDFDSCETVSDLIGETKCFIDWIKPDPTMTSDASSALTELAEDLDRWENTCRAAWSTEHNRLAISREAGEWAQHVLQLSGLQNRARPA